MYDSDTILLTDNQILIKAAQKNYHVFATPTNLVESVKLKRSYTAEQQADLDIKTSVNKIGEIVNLSQVLNSMYWDQYHHGKTHEELHDLYCDMATLDVMSNLEIDKAKKEFSVDNAVELNLIRDKYAEQLTTEEGKKILPNFFSHIARLKGYYDPHKKVYLQHDTSMDYVQRIVRKFRTKNKFDEPTSLLSDIFGTKRYYERNVDKKQVSHIMKAIIAYSYAMQNLFNAQYYSDALDKTLTGEERHEKCQMLYQELIDEISQYRVGYSTMVFMIKSLEHKDKRRYRNILLQALFTVCRDSFLDAVKQSQEQIRVLEDGGTDVFLYDFGLKFTNF